MKDFVNIKQLTEDIEKASLAEYATFSSQSKGREVVEKDHDFRTDFQRDRDRIIHSKSFRRLMHKTQVFLSPEGDHYRTRLTHTLEVSQIARSISRALRLNEDLTEAIALGHDLGHTPFGHAGERALNDILPKGFRHYEQSVRVVQKLEKNGRGLNLTYEVIDGILNHTKSDTAFTPEGKVVRFADRIAYMNHDIDDAIEANVLTDNDIPTMVKDVLGRTKTQRITSLITSIIKNSENGTIKMSDEVFEAYNLLHRFMYDSVYLNPYAKKEEQKVPHIIEALFDHFSKIGNLPQDMLVIAERDGTDTAVADYIAGMTDRYAVYYYEKLFIPKSWSFGM